MATYSPVGYWLDMPIVEMLAWADDVAEVLREQQKG